MNEEVAVKRVAMPMDGEKLDMGYLTEMKKEAERLAALRHQNILAVRRMSVYRSKRSGRYDLYLIMDLMAYSLNQVKR